MAPVSTVRVPCPHHLWHDLQEVDVAELVAALTGALASELMARDDDGRPVIDAVDEAMRCPREIIEGDAQDVEMYAEHVESAVLGMGGLFVEDDEEYGHSRFRHRVESDPPMDERPDGREFSRYARARAAGV